MPERPPLVRIFKDAKQISALTLTGTRYVIGRNSSADIRLDDSTVSRPHAEILRGPFGRWWVQDLGSKNCTMVGGQPILKEMLHHRDRISVGDFIVEFRHVRREPAIRVSSDSHPFLDEESMAGEETMQIARIAPPSSRRAGITPEHLSALTAVTSQMLATEDGPLRLEVLCESFIQTLPGDSSMVLRLAEDGSSTIVSGPFNRYPGGPVPYCSKTLISALQETKEAIVATNISAIPNSTELSLAEAVRPLAIIACPIKEARSYIDVLWVEFPLQYATQQWRAMVQLAADGFAQARMVSQMRHDLRTAARIEHDLELAHDVQNHLLPDCARIKQLDVAMGYEPSHWVGGDYVDALRLSDGRVLLVIADVCGKGLSAALVSSSVHTMIHAVIHSELNIATLVARMNEYFCAHLSPSSFVTLLAIVIDPKDGELECLNAGHPPAVVVSDLGEQRWLQAEKNFAVGMVPDATYEVERTQLGPTDTLLMYTDGAFERFGEPALSVDPGALGDAFADIITSKPGAVAGELCQRLSKALAKLGGAQLLDDDTTFLVARRHSTRG